MKKIGKKQFSSKHPSHDSSRKSRESRKPWELEPGKLPPSVFNPGLMNTKKVFYTTPNHDDLKQTLQVIFSTLEKRDDRLARGHPVLFFMQGLPGSGKSTIATELILAILELQGIIRDYTVSLFISDTIRKGLIDTELLKRGIDPRELPEQYWFEGEVPDELLDQETKKKIGRKVWEIFHKQIAMSARVPFSAIVLDNLNTKMDRVEEKKNIAAAAFGDEPVTIGVHVSTPPEVAWQRNLNRERKVPREAFEYFIKGIEPMEDHPEVFDFVLVVNN